MLAKAIWAPLSVWHRLTGKLNREHRTGLFSVGWTSLAQFVTINIRLASNLILTRLLAPEAYGLLGSAMAIVTTLEWLSDMGIQPALIRHPHGGEARFLNTAWLLSVFRGAGISSIAALLAWPTALYYEQPVLTGMLLVLATRPLLISLRSPGMALLRRTLNFRAVFMDEVAQTAAGTLASLLLAWYFHSVWGVVIGTLFGAAAAIAMSYVLVPMKPTLHWDGDAARSIYHLGHQVFWNTLVMAVWLNSTLLVGLRFVAPTAMGYFVVAWNLAAVLEGLITRACDVHFAMLSRLPADQRANRHLFLSHRAALLAMPVMTAGALLAPYIVHVLYDARYATAGFLLGVMIARQMFRSLGQIQFQYLLVEARVRRATVANLVALAVQAACLVPFVHWWGISGLAMSALASTAALTATQTLLVNQVTGKEWTPFLITTGWAAMAVSLLIL